MYKRQCHFTLGAEGRDEGGDDDQPGVDHQPTDLGDAADVFHTVGGGKAQIPVCLLYTSRCV